MSRAKVIIVTSASTAPGAAMLQQSFEAVRYPAKILILGDGHGVANHIDTADKVIFRIGPKSFPLYRDIVLPEMRNDQRKKELTDILNAFDKALQAKILQDSSIPIPATRVVRASNEAADWLPCVIKQAVGNRGDGVFLVHDKTAMIQTVDKLIADQGYCIQQEYIHIRPAQDKRLFVVGDMVVAAMSRTAYGDDFRSNLHQGGSGDAYVPSDDECRIAVRAASCLHLPFCGVDIIDGPEGPLVLEVNPSPGFAIGAITGTPVSDVIAKYFRNGEI